MSHLNDDRPSKNGAASGLSGGRTAPRNQTVGFFSARPGTTLWLASTAIIVSVLGLFSLELHGRYVTTLSDAKRMSQGFSEVLAEHTARTFEAVERTLQVAASIRNDRSNEQIAVRNANETLRSLWRSAPALLAIGWTNETGDVLAHSYDGKPARSNISDLRHFTVQRDNPAQGFFISPLYRSAASNRWISTVSERINKADGRFGGVVSAPLDLAYFARIYQSVKLGPNDTVTLLLRDGTILMREPFIEGAVGKSYDKADLFTKFIERSPTGVFESISPVDNKARIAAYSVVAGLPLVMVVTQDRADVLAQWYDHIRSFGPLVAMLIVVVILGTMLLSRRTQQLVRESTLLAATLDNMHHGLMVVDANQRIAIYNRKAMELLDLPEDFLSAHPPSEDVIAYQASRGEFAEAPEAVKARLLPLQFGKTEYVYERKRPNGTVLEVRTVPFADGGVVRTYRDITDWKRIEHDLSEREKQFRLLAENATDIIARLNFNGRMLYISPSCEAILGYSAPEMQGVRITDYIYPDDVKPTVALFAEIRDGKEPTIHRIEYRFRHKHGHWIWLEANPKLVVDEHGVPIEFVDVVRETTERKKIESVASEARRLAERSAQAQAQFLATMSHELRTPLNSIVGFSDLVLSRGDLPPEAQRQIGLIQTASDTLLTVVNDVLDFSKIEEGKLILASTAFSLRALTQDVVEIVRGSADVKKIDLRLTLDDRIALHLDGDDQRIRQILFNLLNNAIKFTSCGDVALQVALLKSDDAAQRIRFSVSDTGIGIPADKIDRLFQRFSQVDGSTSRDYGGSGLGLAICKRLVEMMGGQIGVTSIPGRGSVFWFEITLPVSHAAPRVLTPLRQPSRTAPARLLLVEDIAVNREIATAVLAEMGYHVDAVSDGSEAIAAVQSKAYDLVLMDIQMPGMDGITATQRIRALPGAVATVPIIAMTANVLTQQIEMFRAAGMNGHLGKPFKRDDLRTAIETCLASTTSTTFPDQTTTPAMDQESIQILTNLLGVGKVDSLLADLKLQLERFSLAIDAPERSRDILFQAHGLISTAGMLGFRNVSDSCARLQCSLSGGDIAVETIDEARTMCVAALRELSQRFAHHDAPAIKAMPN